MANAKGKHRLKRVKLTLFVDVTPGPVTGCCTYRKGKLIYVVSGGFMRDGRVSNFFDWRAVKQDGTLGTWRSGYWQSEWTEDNLKGT